MFLVIARVVIRAETQIWHQIQICRLKLHTCYEFQPDDPLLVRFEVPLGIRKVKSQI